MICNEKIHTCQVYGQSILFTLLLSGPACTAHTDSWNEDFDGFITSTGATIVQHPLVEFSKGFGVSGSNAIKVVYEGYERGSKRVVKNLPLNEVAMAYELSFSVRFCDGFDFAMGGKLHGIGPRKPVTGGKPMTPEGWSARLMFRQGGGLKTYVYHQNKSGKYGDSVSAKNFRFRSGQYYKIDMRVWLNEPASAANGQISVSVDGKELIKHKGLQFRANEGRDGMIQTLLFSTFHGGSLPEYAPRTADGEYKVDCAYFDDWTVYPL